jgi:hypothetical protein
MENKRIKYVLNHILTYTSMCFCLPASDFVDNLKFLGVVHQHGKGAGEGFKRSSSNESKRLARACKGGRRAWREKERHERVKKDSFVPVKVGDVEGRGLLC